MTAILWAVLLFLGKAVAQTTITINGILPIIITVETTSYGVCEVTPSFGARRKLAESHQGARRLSRTLLQQSIDVAIVEYPPNSLALGDAFVKGMTNAPGCILPNISATVTRKLLTKPPSLTFYGEVKKHILKGNAVATYLFDKSTAPFFSLLDTSGSTATSSYTFLRGVLVFPQEYTPSNMPPFAESPTNFVSTNPLKPILVKLSSQGPMDTVPSLALRFDYAQSGEAMNGGPVTPFISVYYSDFAGPYPAGLPPAPTSPTSAGINLGQTRKSHHLDLDHHDQDHHFH